MWTANSEIHRESCHREKRLNRTGKGRIIAGSWAGRWETPTDKSCDGGGLQSPVRDNLDVEMSALTRSRESILYRIKKKKNQKDGTSSRKYRTARSSDLDKC
jgi:hypothetical protein